MRTLAIIGGTGVETLDGVVIETEHSVETPFGKVSEPIKQASYEGRRLYFMHRHGGARGIPPHKVNYQANIWALQSLGVTDILAINAVGSIDVTLSPGSYLVADQIIDYTWGREHTFDVGDGQPLKHIDFTDPYDPKLREIIAGCASELGLACQNRGVVSVTQGPRLETGAEVERLRRDGGDVVGMTTMPEAALARELDMAYATFCVIVNPAAMPGAAPIAMADIKAILDNCAVDVGRLAAAVVQDDHFA